MSAALQHPGNTLIGWMGGSRPAPLLCVSVLERRYVTALFREQCGVWVSYWRDPLPRDVARIFWKRARYDAHATVRDTPTPSPAPADGGAK